MSTELGDFLRARRTDASLSPSSSGVGRRRISGLRREEIAAAAGISVDYYTRLEQGREAHPSDAVIDALARVLDLGADAHRHLRRLRDQPTTSVDVVDAEVLERMDALVAAVRPNPAYVLDRLSTMVAANPEGLAVYDGFGSLPPASRNTCRYLFTDPRAQDRFTEWEAIARGAVMHLRASNAGNLQDPELVELVTSLSAASTEFAEWWEGHFVQRRRTSVIHMRDASGAVAARRYEVLHLPDVPLRMTLWLPAEEESSDEWC